MPHMTDSDAVAACPRSISLRRLRTEYFEDRQPDAEQLTGALSNAAAAMMEDDAASRRNESMSLVGRCMRPRAMSAAPPATAKPSLSGRLKNRHAASTCRSVSQDGAVKPQPARVPPPRWLLPTSDRDCQWFAAQSGTQRARRPPQSESVNALDWDHNAYYHRLLLRHLPRPCNRVLDVGCGAGAFAVELAKRAERVDGP